MNKEAFRNQLLFGLCDGFSALSMGTILGYTSSSLISMYKDSDFELTEEQGNWVGSIVPGMALGGSLAANVVLKSLGRKGSMLLASVLTGLTWLIVANASNIYQIIAARLIAGLCVGLQQVAVSVYVAETIHPKLRPVLGTIPAITGAFGFMLINIIPESITNWRGVAFVGAASSIPLVLLLLNISDSPLDVLKKGDKKGALQILINLRESREEAEKEFTSLEGTTKSVNKINYETLFKPPNRWPVTIAILLHLFQPLTGFLALSAFMGLILERADSFVSSNTTTLITTIVNLVTVVTTSKLPSLYGRRKLIKWSSQIITGGHISLCFYLLMKERESPLASYLTIIPFISFITYAVGFSIGWGPIPWMFIGDGLPLAIRSEVSSLIIAINWGSNFVVSKLFSLMAHYFGYSGLLAFYALSTILAKSVMENHLPETFGFTADQIDQYYKDSYSTDKKKDQ